MTVEPFENICDPSSHLDCQLPAHYVQIAIRSTVAEHRPSTAFFVPQNFGEYGAHLIAACFTTLTLVKSLIATFVLLLRRCFWSSIRLDQSLDDHTHT